MIERYITTKGWPIDISSIEDVDFERITTDFNHTKKTVRTEYILPRISFIGNFRTLSLTCQRHIAKNLGFEFIKEIPFGECSIEQMQLIASKWTDIIKDFTKLIVLGEPCLKKIKDNIMELDKDAEYYLFKTFKRDKEPVYLKYNIPITLESEIIRLHSEYPKINNNTSWESEPSLKFPKQYCKKFDTFNDSNEKKVHSNGIQFGLNCKYFVPQYSKCQKSAMENLSKENLIRKDWVEINKAILYAKMLNFDLLDKVKNGEVKVKNIKSKGKKDNNNKNGSLRFQLEASFDYDDCSLCDCGGSCRYFEKHNGKQINCLMDGMALEEHPNYHRYLIDKEEAEIIKKRVRNPMIQDELFK